MFLLWEVCTLDLYFQFWEYILLVGGLHVPQRGPGPGAEVPVVSRPGAEVPALLAHHGRGRVCWLGPMHLVLEGEELAPTGGGLQVEVLTPRLKGLAMGWAAGTAWPPSRTRSWTGGGRCSGSREVVLFSWPSAFSGDP